MCRWWLLSTACFALPHLHAPCGGNLMWWLWHRLQWRQWQEARAAQVPLLFTIQMIFFFCNPFPFFSSKRDKVRTRTHYAFGWCEPLVKYRKIKVLSAWGETVPSLPHLHCSSTSHLLWTIKQNTIHQQLLLTHESMFFLDFCQQRYPLKMHSIFL